MNSLGDFSGFDTSNTSIVVRIVRKSKWTHTGVLEMGSPVLVVGVDMHTHPYIGGGIL